MIIKSRKILYKDWIYTWLIEKRDYIKESTYANYSNNIFNHIIPKLGNYTLKDINHKIIQDFLLELSKNGRKDKKGGLSEKTIKDITIIVKGSIKKGINEGKIKHIELSFNYPKDNKEKSIYILTKYEQNKITNYVLDNRNTKNIGFLISLYSGIRIGELCALQWKDIDFKNNKLMISKTIQRVYIKDKDKSISKVIITTPKTKNANREIPVNKDFLEIIKSLKTDKDNYILSNSDKYIEPRTYRKYFNKILKELKIKHFNFHSLRHTFATNCISLGCDYKTVSELLGHANVNITLNLYVHPRYSQKKKCIDLVSKIFQEKVKK
ncbi:MAG: site-specific integrase [Sarcina ventriculi]|nr:site-specific integrase [Sarcina ventriculi]